MRIGFISLPDRGAMDLRISALADDLMAAGIHVAGAVQHNIPDGTDCDMDLQILPAGPRIRISQSLGKGAESCKLDTSALETAVGEVAARMDGADLLIINKFGKHEAAGRGFRAVIAGAVGEGLPVLLGVNAANRAAFLAFAGDMAEELSPEGVPGWLASARAGAL